MRRPPLENFVFRFSRAFATIGSVVALACLAIALIAVPFTGRRDTQVEYKDVKLALNPPEKGSTEAFRHVAPDLYVPPKVDEYLSGENRAILQGWVEPLSPNDRQGFVDELEDVIQLAEANSDDVVDVINKFREVKLERLQMSEFERYAAQGARYGMLGVAFAMAVLVVLLSVVLLLLAIEENTRGKSIAPE